ncbi:DUF4173 domain-containing protein [Stappia sp. GBMRC 2046]|uniref:DUF4173 domain-containing protein n=1 Tax=Stappia sediminis TaxID=2692190 RepID=A0A7X3S781_9HYPH|nr:DUF4173 domain-containing protein [Stappia sediminis]MXN64516.1 DUF4173 domain-containing protein [Stappia sediminis]
MLVLAAGVLLANRLRATWRERILAASVLVLSLCPAAEAITPLSVIIGAGGVALFVLKMTGNGRVAPPVLASRMTILLTAGLSRIGRHRKRWRRPHHLNTLKNLGAASASWLAPMGLGLVFVVIFSEANPIFWSWVSVLDPRSLLASLEPRRLLFWVLLGIFLSPFVRVPAFVRARIESEDIHILPESWFVETAFIVRSLVVLNAVFALQTVLDMIYLWGGAQLPEGVSPAADAQKAAYLLVVSALLAAGFVLLATRNAAEGAMSRLVRKLIYLWIAQNVVLIFSAILRLDLYVETFSLTRLRLAAFIWMGLVVAGLVLIVLRLVLSRSNRWLVNANLIALAIALYGCSIVDLNRIIADYNVVHSREVSGRGGALDRNYLCGLGASALPAIDTFLAGRKKERRGGWVMLDLANCAETLRRELHRGSGDWRSWTFRKHRLRDDLAMLM